MDTVRYHVYFAKYEYIFPDGIYYLSNFEARLLQPTFVSQNELDAVGDAV